MTKLKHFSQANFPPAFLWVFDSSKSHSKHFIISTCDTQNFDVVSRASSFVSLFHRILSHSKLPREKCFNEKFLPFSTTPPTRWQIFASWCVIFRARGETELIRWKFWWEIKISGVELQWCGEYRRSEKILQWNEVLWLRGVYVSAMGNCELIWMQNRVMELLLI